MNTNIKNIVKTAAGLMTMLITLHVSLFTFSSCSDDPTAENFYTFTGEMVSDFLENNPEQYSEFVAVLKKSGMYGMMATYGTYTCLAPTNEAIAEYIKAKGFVCVDSMSKAECDTLAWNHIIAKTYFTTDLSIGNIPAQNMNDRFLSFSCATDSGNNDNIAYYINTHSKLIAYDDSVENGVVHTLNHVLQPTNDFLPDLMESDSTISLFVEAMKLTHMNDSMYKYLDMNYTIDPDSAYGKKMDFPRLGGAEHWYGNYIAKRMQRYTAFVERNEVFHENGIDSMPQLIAYAKSV